MAPHAWVISLTSVCKTSLNRVLHFISYRMFQGKLTDERLMLTEENQFGTIIIIMLTQLS